MKKFIILAVLAALIAFALAQSERAKGWERRSEKAKAWGRRRGGERRGRRAQEESDFKFLLPIAANYLIKRFKKDDVEEEADWFLPAAKLAVKYGPAVYSAVRRRRDAEESDIWGFAAKLAAKKLGGALVKRIGKRRDSEESDAEFFSKVGSFLKKHVTSSNIQKGLDIYNQVRNDNVESDAEFFSKVGSFLKKHVTSSNIQKGLDIYNQFRNDDVEESELMSVVAGMAARKVGGSLMRKFGRRF